MFSLCILTFFFIKHSTLTNNMPYLDIFTVVEGAFKL